MKNEKKAGIITKVSGPFVAVSYTHLPDKNENNRVRTAGQTQIIEGKEGTD